MSEMYRCDRCEGAFDGSPSPDVKGDIPWAPSLHSHEVSVEVEFSDFGDNWTFAAETFRKTALPELCAQCMADILLLFILKHLKAKATIQFPAPTVAKEPDRHHA